MATRVREAVEAPLAGYGGSGDRPLGSYAALTSVWLSGFLGFLALVKTLNRPIPRIDGGDLLLLSGATFHLSRLITKDAVLSFLRAPFTRYVERGAPSETNEEPRKETEFQHAVGELVSCPFCMATWVAAAFTYGYTFFPRLTRLVAAMFCIIGLSDVFQIAYGTAHQKASQ